ncbi:MAG: DUF1015 domain-containing protein [Acidobacteriota bacterium]
MKIYAFEGFRFTSQVGEAGEQGAPPFDQINEQRAQEFHARSPHHFAHLTRPAPENAERGITGSTYQRAASTHQQWLASGAVVRDGKPALYPYIIEVADGTRRIGVCALVGVEPEGSTVIRPHEHTLDKPFADRLEMTRTTEIDLEPVMFLADDPQTLEDLVLQDAAGSEPAVTHRDDDGNLHKLWVQDNPERILAYQRELANRPAAIADGHHRYKVARTYAEQTHAAPGTAAGAKMTVLFSLHSKDVVIDPIHRALGAGLDLASLHPMLASRGTVTVSSGAEFAALIAQEDNPVARPALGILTADGHTEIWHLDPRRMPEGRAPGADRLAVCHLHWSLLPQLGLSEANYLDGTVIYRSFPDELWTQVKNPNNPLAVGIFLPPMSGPLFGHAVSKGDVLPAKSTRFLPKLASGLVWVGHDAKLI